MSRDAGDRLVPDAWVAARTGLGMDGLGVMNLGVAAADRHACGPWAKMTALSFVTPDGAGMQDISYAELAHRSNRFANGLRALGVVRGERVFVLLERCPALYVAVLGALKAGAVVAPLSAAFGPEPIRVRLALGGAAVLVTDAPCYRDKLAPMRAQWPSLRQVLLVREADNKQELPGTIDLVEALAAADDTPPGIATGPDDPALLHFTSGTTGTPKGVLHGHGVGLNLFSSAREALDLHAADRFWCTADPGWVTGTAYGILAPLLHGATVVVDAGPFDARRWFEVLERARVSVWYSTPTAIRLLMRAHAAGVKLPRPTGLRVAASCGEPLDPGAVRWGERVLGRPFHDNWWQTETGAIMLANIPARQVTPGAMGRPLAGIEARVVHRKSGGGVTVIDTPEATGELALVAGWPSMFRDYLGAHDRYGACFADGLYLSGDLVRRDARGDYWFLGRADDVIKSSGHLIGPCEVERVLMAHPAVAEAAVIGLPDPTCGERVEAVVVGHAGATLDEALARTLLAHARTHLGAVMAPKRITFAAALPHTRSGKIMRRLLRARALGLPEGDLSMLEHAEVPNEP
ncbi:AMP-binding protein [Azoarcus sp. L1K30]|uniref:AMP-binding protein n=1 Tax=Azoarcus sp. L1K30 TaxID=2820277 RepID=UPI001B8191B6|nr:AMP-binding protein [Azoarcus sp. L1K30]MBR0565667.1 AMP-binding protein [Azoarcus sp. L1K30]